jgi:hypothetical protein
VSIFRNTSSPGSVSFAARIHYPTSNWPSEAVASGDLDGDGKPDLAVANDDGNGISGVSVLKNLSTVGSISFAARRDYTAGAYSTDVAISDIDGDRKPDVIVANDGSNTVSVLRNLGGNGILSFATKVDFSTGKSPFKVALGDLDGDDKLDFVTANKDANTASVLLNLSTPGFISFAQKVDYATGIYPLNVAISDLDGDGKPDVGIANSNFGSTGTVAVLRNLSSIGTLSFAPKLEYAVGSGPIGIAAGDLDGDGKPDLAASNSADRTVSVLRNQMPTCTQPTFLNNLLIVLDASCGNNDGSITIKPTSGIAPFMYSINGGITYTAGADSGFTFNNLAVGAYQLRLKNSNGCESEIVERMVKTAYGLPTFVNNNLIVLNATCANNDGNINIIPTSGTAPFTYSINGGATYVTGPNAGYGFQNLAAGTYKLRLKDAKGCQSEIIERQVNINCTSNCTPPTFVNNNLIILDATCANNDGNINIIPTSGTAPFMYSINGGTTYVAGPNAGYGFQNLPSGTYKLRLKDANGCESAIVEREVKLVCSSTCTPPTFVNNGLIVLDASCGKGDGAINIIPTSGTAPFMYSINGGATYVAGPNAGYGFQNLPAGTYQLRLKDANGCESAIVERTVRNYYNCPGITVSTNPSEASLVLSNKDVVATSPNPNSGQFKLLLENFQSPKAEVSIYDAKGTLIQKRSLNLTQNTIADFNIKGKAPGLYLIKVVTASGIKNMKVSVQ